MAKMKVAEDGKGKVLVFEGPTDFAKWTRKQAQRRRLGKPWTRTNWNPAAWQTAMAYLRDKFRYAIPLHPELGMEERPARAQRLFLHHAKKLTFIEGQLDILRWSSDDAETKLASLEDGFKSYVMMAARKATPQEKRKQAKARSKKNVQ